MEVMYFLKCIFSKVYFCEMYPTCVSSKLCEFICVLTVQNATPSKTIILLELLPSLKENVPAIYEHVLDQNNTNQAPNEIHAESDI